MLKPPSGGEYKRKAHKEKEPFMSISTEVKKNVQGLFINKYIGSGVTKPITRKAFLEAGWTALDYFQFYTTVKELHALCIARDVESANKGDEVGAEYVREKLEDISRVLYALTGVDCDVADRYPTEARIKRENVAADVCGNIEGRFAGKTMVVSPRYWTRLPGNWPHSSDEAENVAWADEIAQYGIPMPFSVFISTFENNLGRLLKPEDALPATLEEAEAREAALAALVPQELDMTGWSKEDTLAQKAGVLKDMELLKEKALDFDGYEAPDADEQLWAIAVEAEKLSDYLDQMDDKLAELEG